MNDQTTGIPRTVLSKISRWLVRNSFLFRLLFTICVAVCFPMLIVQYTVVRQSYLELAARDNDAYKRIVHSFATNFNSQVSSFIETALNISFERKIRIETVEKSVWGELEAISLLKSYKTALPTTRELGLHFAGANYIITSAGYKDFLDMYIGKQVGKHLQASRELDAFFMSYYDSRPVIISTFKHDIEKDPIVIIGVPVSIGSRIRHDGNYYYDGMFFYVLDNKSLDATFASVVGSDLYGLAIYDEAHSPVYANLAYRNMGISGGEVFDYPGDSQEAGSFLTSGGQNAKLFRYVDSDNGWTYICAVEDSEVKRYVINFYRSTRFSLLLMIFGLLVGLLMTLLLNYRPLISFIRRIGVRFPDKNLSELERIEHGFIQMEETALQRTELLTDYLFRNLIYGINIPPVDIKSLGLELDDKFFMVVILSDKILTSTMRTELINAIQKELDCNVYLSEQLTQNNTIIVLMLKHNNASLVQEKLYELIRNICGNITVGYGSIAENVNQVQSSYMDALISQARNHRHPLPQEYPQEDLSIFLYHISRGEQNEATEALKKVFAKISNIRNPFSRRYISYNILTAYLDSLQKLKCLYPDLALQLMIFNNTDDLYKNMHDSIDMVCSLIREKYMESMHSLNKKILDYIDENYTSPDISLSTVADKFNMSIYTFSRLFKSYNGVGFRQYIIGKRIEKAQSLLLTTDVPVKEVAAKVGFESTTYFHNLFKVYTGTTPSRYRGI